MSTEPGPSRAIADVGPFFHGTRADLRIGDLLTAGAEMARGHGGPRVYVVEPLGDFQNDPNDHRQEIIGALKRRVAIGMGEIINWMKVRSGSVSQAEPLTLYGAAGSGSVAVEAALTLLGMPFEVIEGATWSSSAARRRLSGKNLMRQIPTLVFPHGEVLTESAAILIYLADAHPGSALAPGLEEPARRQFLRWMLYVSSAIYALHWIKPDVRWIGAPPALRDAVVDAVHERIAFCWGAMDGQLEPGRYLLGETMSVLDLYVTVVSRFGPWRRRFYAAAPKMAEVVRRVDSEPRLAALWAKRFPFDEGWEE